MTADGDSGDGGGTADDRFGPGALGALGALVAFGVGLRVFLLQSALGVLDSDEAVVGLMARHLRHGEVSAFFWGQSYGGTHEAFLAFLSFAVLGPSRVALKLVPLALATIAAVLIWRIGRRTVGHRAGVVAAVIWWVWPATFVWWSTKERGFYWSAMVLGLAAVLFALRLGDDPRSRRDWIGFGLAAGLGWWATPQSVLFLLPAGGWLVVRLRRHVLPGGLLALPFAALGALPWLLFSVRNGWSTLDGPPVVHDESYLGHLGRFFERGAPVGLGVRAPYTEAWLHPTVGPLLAWLSIVVLVYAVLARRKGAGFIVLAVVAYPFLMAIAPQTAYVGEGRYLLFWLPFVALLLAHAAHRWWATVVLFGVLVGLTIGGLTTMKDGLSPGFEGPPVPISMVALRDALDRRGVDRVIADYWIAYRLTFETDERVVAATTHDVRYQPYQDMVRASPSPAWVFVAGSTAEPRLRAALDAMGVPFERFEPRGFVVYLPARRVLPEDLPPPTPS